MKEAVFRAELLKTQQTALLGNISPKAVITGMRLANGSYHVLSRYGDNTWTLPDNLFPAGTIDSDKRLNFLLVPPQFREMMRLIMALYIFVGIEGRKRPKGGTIQSFFLKGGCFLRWLSDKYIYRLNEVTPLICQQYVDYCKGQKGRAGKPLSGRALALRFLAVEKLHMLSCRSADPMRHPWQESSASYLAGITGQNKPEHQEAKTEIIPNTILGPLLQSAVEWLNRADEIIRICDQIEIWKAQGRGWKFINSRLKKKGWTQKSACKEQYYLHSACLCIILITSGIRVSEVCSLENQCWETTKDELGESYYWMKGISYKTDVGECEWLIPNITVQAIKKAEGCVKPLQAKLVKRISDLKAKNPMDPEITRLSKHADRLFLGITVFQKKCKGTFSRGAVLSRLNEFAAQCGLDWHFTPHQFRRTFAVYAAHSALGDLRYLRDYFKHWGLDMTNLYGMNRKQDAELYDEIGLEALRLKTDLLEHWLDQDSIITGGGADPIRTFRTNSVALTTKKDRAEMAKTLSPLVHLRATGVAWCTADTGGCNGGQGVEKTRCGDCSNAVIDVSRQPVWEGIYAHQVELRYLTDIGPSGAERIERDIERCKHVLVSLGATDMELSNVET